MRVFGILDFVLQIKDPTNIEAIVSGVLGAIFVGAIAFIIVFIYRRFFI